MGGSQGAGSAPRGGHDPDGGRSPAGRLAEKKAVITGASRGIGRAIALSFASEGADVVVNYVRDESAASECASLVRSRGVRAYLCQADVSTRAGAQALIAFAAKSLGRIDILVNNAGINKRGFLDEVTDEDWDRIMDTNLKGPFMCSQEVFPVMIAQGGGRIINISSVAGEYHGPKTVHYAVSKAGLNSLTKVLARYGAPHSIYVNAVAPGLIRTDQTADEFDSPAGQAVLDLTLLKRAGAMADVTSACLFLAEDAQTYMTGQVLSVSGGAILG